MRYYTYGMPTKPSRTGPSYDAATAPVLFLHGVGPWWGRLLFLVGTQAMHQVQREHHTLALPGKPPALNCRRKALP